MYMYSLHLPVLYLICIRIKFHNVKKKIRTFVPIITHPIQKQSYSNKNVLKLLYIDSILTSSLSENYRSFYFFTFTLTIKHS